MDNPVARAGREGARSEPEAVPLCPALQCSVAQPWVVRMTENHSQGHAGTRASSGTHRGLVITGVKITHRSTSVPPVTRVPKLFHTSACTKPTMSSFLRGALAQRPGAGSGCSEGTVIVGKVLNPAWPPPGTAPALLHLPGQTHRHTSDR